MATNGARKTFTATIGRVNDHGFQIQERPGTWLNLSKFDDPQPVIPPAGTPCKLTIDASGFVRAIEPLEREAQDELPFMPDRRPSLSTGITRLAVLKAAARFMAGRSDITPDDVLAVAHAWETWVNTP